MPQQHDEEIRKIVATMVAEPGLSSEAALLRTVAAHQAPHVRFTLRAMRTEGRLARMLRRAVHDVHVRLCTAGTEFVRHATEADRAGQDGREPDSMTFTTRYLAGSAPVESFVCMASDGTFSTGRHRVPSRSAGLIVAGLGIFPDDDGEKEWSERWSGGDDAENGHRELLELGLSWPSADGVFDRAAVHPPAVVGLGRRLAAAWWTVPEACEGLTGDQLLAEACRIEAGRMDASGLAWIRSQWGPDMTLLATIFEDDENYDFRLLACLRDPRRARTMAGVGCLLNVFTSSSPSLLTDTDPWGAFFDAFMGGFIGCFTEVLTDEHGSERPVQEDDATWLWAVFGGAQIAAIPVRALSLIVRYRMFLDVTLLGPVEEKAALVQIAGSAGAMAFFDDDDAEMHFFEALRDLAEKNASYAGVIRAVPQAVG